MKKGLKGKGFFTDYRKVEGVLGKNAILFLLPSAWNRGGGGGPCAGQSRRPGLDGGPGQGEKREGGEANRSPSSPCAGVERGGPATEASSGGWRC